MSKSEIVGAGTEEDKVAGAGVSQFSKYFHCFYYQVRYTSFQSKPLEVFKIKAEENNHEPEENIVETNIPTFNRFLKLSKLFEEPDSLKITLYMYTHKVQLCIIFTGISAI